VTFKHQFLLEGEIKSTQSTHQLILAYNPIFNGFFQIFKLSLSFTILIASCVVDSAVNLIILVRGSSAQQWLLSYG
jgi:hypothetical protein